MTVTLLEGDCREQVAAPPANSVDAVVTDPPYALVSIAKRFSADDAAPVKSNGPSGVYARAAAGFMGKKWDTGEVAFDPAFWSDVMRVLKPGGHVLAFGGTRTVHRLTVAIEDAGFEIRDMIAWVYGTGFPKSHNLDGGLGTALKPALEPITVARKPLVGTVAANVLRHGTGALNIDGCRVGDTVETWPASRSYQRAETGGRGQREYQETGKAPPGRWPANLITDGSDEVTGLFPQTTSGVPGVRRKAHETNAMAGRLNLTGDQETGYGDTGSAARFYYCAKASKADRAGSKHPTVKPIALMRYLCRLVTPPGGVVLDPFAGSGTTGAAAIAEGFRPILIEREAEYIADIRRRLGLDALEDLLA